MSSIDKLNGTIDDPVIIKFGDSKTSRKIRIVHISDTHQRHDEFLPNIPEGDVIIHSGDFSHFALSRFITRKWDYLAEIEQINRFFSKLPHRHKIFVAGNHEMNFKQYNPKKTQALLTECIYLQDSSVVIDGIKIYGSPWNGLRRSSYARGFSVPYEKLDSHWGIIPDDVDVLVTHQPAQDILDGGPHRRRPNLPDIYMGCRYLRHQILERVRPKLHCFGHVHGDNGIIEMENTIFSNAAMNVYPYPKVIDLHIDAGERKTDLSVEYYKDTDVATGCAVM